jgi:hypothetical protein
VAEIRLRLFAATTTGQAGGLLLLPHQRRFAAVDGSFETPLPHAIYTDIPAGQGLFGGAYPLISGNPVTSYHGLEHAEFGPEDLSMTPDDLIIIEVRVPAAWPRSLEIANEPGGRIQLEMAEQKRPVFVTRACGEPRTCRRVAWGEAVRRSPPAAQELARSPIG